VRVFFILILLQVFLGPSARAAESVRVRLESRLGSLKLSGISMQFPGHRNTSGLSGPSAGYQTVEIQFKKTSGKLYEWTVLERGTGEILAKFKASVLEISGEMMRSSLRAVPDHLVIRPIAPEKSDLIATIDLEEYLRGVLPMEMPAAWPVEALKAQAIAARTFALFKRGERLRAHAAYDLESDVMDQVFQHESALSETQKTKVAMAVEDTKGIVLADHRSHLVPSFFHADCGGQTEDGKAVWGGSTTASAVDESCPSRSLWEAKFSREEIVRRLARQDSQISAKKLAWLNPLNRTKSGRIALLKAVWTDGSETEMSGHAFRMAMGHDVIKSTKFDLKVKADGQIEFKGAGFGHGVGLCQWGARQMAAAGKSHETILAHYYPGSTLRALR
jgi:SpoIID/LytB domain protein